jgi:hypothetical protein
VQVLGVGVSLSVLRMVVESKVETVSLLRQRLKEENVSLKTDLETLLAKQYACSGQTERQVEKE